MNLYIVATPIGNLQDITIRAGKTLLTVPVIATESASKAGILLNFLENHFKEKRSPDQKIISITQEEEAEKLGLIIRELEKSDVALVSEAGTPLISDPGFKLVREAIKQNVEIIPIPGASAPISALSASGLPTDKFLFVGYLPKQEMKKEKQLQNLKRILSLDEKFSPTVILFESPYRLIRSLNSIKKVFGNIEIVLARELTKIHEEFKRQRAEEMIKDLESKPIKGEITLLFSLK